MAISPERWRQIDDVFNEALDRLPEERSAFLDEACAGDPALRREVDSLLASSSEASGRLQGAVGREAERIANERAASSAPIASALEAGTSFAHRFTIEGRAGSGGMGDVYRARDVSTGALVALKLMHAEAGSQGRERFERESRLLSELRHPGIVAHVAHGEAPDGRRYLAMEWLDGEDLGARLGRGPLALADAVLLVKRVAEALSAAHEIGVIHRDLKPANIFLPGGDIARPKILDFGVARRLAASRAMTRTGLLVGTPDYMAPEQARGSRDLGPAADVFALGCMLYECIAGEPPFAAEHVAAVLTRILFEDPSLIEERRPGVPEALVRLLDRMLAKDPRRRFADGRALADAIAELGEMPMIAGAPSAPNDAKRPPSFAEKEQGLLCVVIASPHPIGADDATLPLSESIASDKRHSELISELRALGVEAELLADGSLVVTVAAIGSATDQAARAARAALVIKERWPSADVALATGRGGVEGRAAVGEVVDRAASLLRSRASGVCLDPLSARLLDSRFVLAASPDGALLLGEEKDADATRLLLGKPTPCVGRAAELGSIEAQLAGSIDESEARVVLITAPPGAGKSRLRHELLRRVEARGDAVTVLLGRGDPMGVGAPYGILRPALARLFGLHSGLDLADQRTRIEARAGARAAPFLGELCGVSFPDEGNLPLIAAREDPKIMRDQIEGAFVEWLRAELARAAVLVVLDDLHWGDALTVTLFDRTLRELEGSPLLVLSLARPEVFDAFPKLWQGHKLSHIALKGLGKKACERLIHKVLGEQAPEVAARIAEQSAGNALFLEELIRAAASGEIESQPETVVAMLQARIGRFDAGQRRALRAASVFGPTFWRGGVAALLGTTAARDVDAWLAALVEAEVVERSPASLLRGDEEYGFRHALVRDAAYGLLTPADVSIGHRQAGAFLEAAGADDPTVIADHFERGGALARAVPFWVRAAERAVDSHDLEGATRCAERGIGCGADGEALGTLRAIEGVVAVRHHRIDACFDSVQAALPLLRAGSRSWTRAAWPTVILAQGGPPEIRATAPHLAASFLHTEPEPDARAAYVDGLFWIFCYFLIARPAAEARAAAQRIEQLSALEADRSHAMQRWAPSVRCNVTWWCDPQPWHVMKEAEEAMERCRAAGDSRLLTMVSLTREVSRWELGDRDGAIDALRSETQLAEIRQDNMTRWNSTQHLGRMLAQRGDAASLEEAERLSADVLESQKIGLMPAWARANIARVKLARGQSATDDARRGFRVAGYAPRAALLTVAPLVRALLAEGRTSDAANAAGEGLALLATYGLGFGDVELRVAASEAFHAAGDHERARAVLAETLQRISATAQDIPDPAWRERYLSENRDNVHARELARAWNADT